MFTTQGWAREKRCRRDTAGSGARRHTAAYQAISELSAFESPVRPLMMEVILVHSVPLLAFGVGVLHASRWKPLVGRRPPDRDRHRRVPYAHGLGDEFARYGAGVQRHDEHHLVGCAQRVSAWRVRSQFGSQLCPFIGVRERPTDRFASVNDDMRTPLDLGLRIWKAGWVQALAGSNPASSASWKTGSDLRKRRSDQISPGWPRIKHRAGQSQFRSQFPAADCPQSGLSAVQRVRRRSLTCASPDQPAARAGAFGFAETARDLSHRNQERLTIPCQAPARSDWDCRQRHSFGTHYRSRCPTSTGSLGAFWCGGGSWSSQLGRRSTRSFATSYKARYRLFDDVDAAGLCAFD